MLYTNVNELLVIKERKQENVPRDALLSLQKDSLEYPLRCFNMQFLPV